MVELCKIAVYYSVEKELEESIERSLRRSRDEGLIDCEIPDQARNDGRAAEPPPCNNNV